MYNNSNILENLFLKTNINQLGGNNDIETHVLLKLILVVLVLFFVYIYYRNRIEPSRKENETNIIENNTENNNQTTQQTQQTMEIITPQVPIIQTQDIYGILRNYDYKTYNDPLTPPFKRDDYMIPADVVDPYSFGMYTRGGPTAFKKMGYLVNNSADVNDKYKFLTLMGRQKYYNSTQYEYYIVSTNRDENIKFFLHKYKRELFTGDMVKVHQLDNKEYEVHIDKELDYEYTPYII